MMYLPTAFNDPRSDEACALALRVEAAIEKLDARLAVREEWRDAVAEWRNCVQRFGPGSWAAAGALIGVVGSAWKEPVAIEPMLILHRMRVMVAGHSFNFASLHEALANALESVP